MTYDLDPIVLKSDRAGPKILVLGAVHGDERCGPEGIAYFLETFEKQGLSLSSGQVTFVPVCNPLAYAQKTRQVNGNLNRMIRIHDHPQNPEEHYANQLCALIKVHDAVLDIHSYHNGTEPFLFLDRDDAVHRAYAAALPFAYWVTGWDNLYAGQADLNQGDTISFAHGCGKTAILIECGSHAWPDGGKLAEQSITAALQHFGVLASVEQPKDLIKPIIIETDRMALRQPGASFTQDWQHLDQVSAGTVLSAYSDGTPSDIAPYDCFLVIPHKDADAGREWLYYGLRRE